MTPEQDTGRRTNQALAVVLDMLLKVAAGIWIGAAGIGGLILWHPFWQAHIRVVTSENPPLAQEIVSSLSYVLWILGPAIGTLVGAVSFVVVVEVINNGEE